MAVKQGDKVKIEYEGKLDDGKLFDSTTHGDHSHPLEFEIGSKKVLPAFEENVIGMEKGQEKEFKIPADKAYGPVNEKAIQEVPKSAFPTGQEPKAGMMIGLKAPNGQQFPAKIKEVKDDKVILDMNHPLAGQNLNFKIKLIEVESK